MSHSSEYSSWSCMKQRTTNPNDPRWADYGGRGIGLCAAWHSFKAFYADMGPRPEGTSLDRIDNDKGYSPENCRWATRDEQYANMRSNRRLSFNGETKTLREWARTLNINESTLSKRLLRGGWPVEMALTDRSDPRMAGAQ